MLQYSRVLMRLLRMRPSSRGCRVALIVLLLGAGITAPAHGVAGSHTLATFTDPALESTTPLFVVNVTEGTLTGGWDLPGMDLTFPGSGTFADVIFTVTPTSYSGTIEAGETGSGGFAFFEAGADVGSDTPLLEMSFDKALVSPGSIYATTLNAIDVDVSGSAVPSGLEDVSFAFGLANQTALSDDEGFTATASFTSSAIPEPSLLLMLLAGIPVICHPRRDR